MSLLKLTRNFLISIVSKQMTEAEARALSLLQTVETGCLAHLAFSVMDTGALSSRVSRSRRVTLTTHPIVVVGEAERCVGMYMRPSSAEVSAEWSYNSTPPYALMV
jgi:hypothetical protein